ncbi:DUF2291 family protein [Labrys wisconsinensis]|uniref:Lipoprotein n=1 Tax=Labrys wisconsinensis TaxID=425677 RepID=A0ABU0JFV5_9HYPH|nr:DUF2291 domain-containing protein [Labrys wisconsinensis]MDQ0473172.1 putative lipoprotein [Labrys wisconsinensis]
MPSRSLTLTAAVIAGLALPGCKIVRTADVQAGQDQAAAAFDPDRMVADLWDAKLVPYFEGKAKPFAEVIAAVRGNPDEAGRQYGYREQPNAPWTYMAMVKGRIVSADTGTRAATVGVDTDGDGKADVTVQIGPVIRGTVLRDALDFVTFNSFTDQTAFARFGKAFNTYVDRQSLSKLPREGLVGRSLTVTGAFPPPKPGEAPLLTPALISLDPAS